MVVHPAREGRQPPSVQHALHQPVYAANENFNREERESDVTSIFLQRKKSSFCQATVDVPPISDVSCLCALYTKPPTPYRRVRAAE